MNDLRYSLDVFESHAARAALAGELAEKTILELGPGDSIASAVIAFAHGARAVLVDVGAFADRDPNSYLPLIKELSDRGLASPMLEAPATIEGLLERCHGVYVTNGLASLREVADASVDLVFSHAVLEHVRRHDFVAIQREIYRALKPTGICSHRVDLRDHLGGRLDNLRFSDRWWESDIFVGSGFYTNRIQLSEMLELFKEAGFHVNDLTCESWPRLPTPKSRMAPRFRSLSDEELCVSGFNILLGSGRGEGTALNGMEP